MLDYFEDITNQGLPKVGEVRDLQVVMFILTHFTYGTYLLDYAEQILPQLVNTGAKWLLEDQINYHRSMQS